MLKNSWALDLIIAIVVVAMAAITSWATKNPIFSPPPPYEQRESVDDPPRLEGDRSDLWPETRAAFVAKHPACAACGKRIELNVHHIIPFYLRPDLELVESNLITLCREHHFRVGHDPDGPWAPERPSWRAYNPRVIEHAGQVLAGRPILR